MTNEELFGPCFSDQQEQASNLATYILFLELVMAVCGQRWGYTLDRLAVPCWGTAPARVPLGTYEWITASSQQLIPKPEIAIPTLLQCTMLKQTKSNQSSSNGQLDRSDVTCHSI